MILRCIPKAFCVCVCVCECVCECECVCVCECECESITMNRQVNKKFSQSFEQSAWKTASYALLLYNKLHTHIYIYIYIYIPRLYNNHHNTVKYFQIWQSLSNLIQVKKILYYFESNFQFFEIMWVNQHISSKFYLICQTLAIFLGNKVGWLSTQNILPYIIYGTPRISLSLRAPQLIKKLPAFCENQWFITVFAASRQWSLFWAR